MPTILATILIFIDIKYCSCYYLYSYGLLYCSHYGYVLYHVILTIVTSIATVLVAIMILITTVYIYIYIHIYIYYMYTNTYISDSKKGSKSYLFWHRA